MLTPIVPEKRPLAGSKIEFFSSQTKGLLEDNHSLSLGPSPNVRDRRSR
jgi:hypothetical protein